MSCSPPSESRRRLSGATRKRLAAAALGGVSLGALSLCVAAASAQPPLPSSAPAGSSSVAPSASVAPQPAPQPAPPDPRVAELTALTAKIRGLIAGTLEEALPDDAFGVKLDDEAAITIEKRRLQAVLRAETPTAGEGGKAQAGGADAAGGAGGARTPADDARWDARLELDRARLAFLQLERSKRDQLLSELEERLRKDDAAETKKELSEAEQKAKDAELERQQSIEAAKKARSEADRMLNSERARLLAIKAKLAELEAKLLAQKQATADERETLLGWQRRVDEFIATANPQSHHAAREHAADTLYDELRDSLVTARDGLAGVLRADDAVDIPGPGPSGLTNLPPAVDRSIVESVRKEVELAALELRLLADTVGVERSRSKMADVETLNRLRLQMLPHLSATKRGELTGFGAAGLSQAAAEGRQVVLTLRYHLAATTSWLDTLRAEPRGASIFGALGLLLRWLLPLGLFIWWRRRVPEQLVTFRDGLRESAKRRRGPAEPGWLERVMSFTIRVRGPVEWLLLLWGVLWVLPAAIRDHLVTQLLATIFVWTASGSLVVRTIDALSSNDVLGRSRSANSTADLRLRSLRLIGRTVVVLGLLLSLSSDLVGEGTIYTWVLTACWVLAVPTLLMVIKWWQPVIFERIGEVRKPNPLEAWVLRRQKGAMSFVAAVAGGAYLFVMGAWRALNGWLVTFNITRRLLAYLFRRDMVKKADERETAAFGPLSDELFTSLGPETSPSENVPSIADEQIQEIVARINRPGGGVFAIVGERGSGKSTVARTIAKSSDDVVKLSCPTGGLDAFKAALNQAMNLGTDAPLEEAIAMLDGEVADAALLVDDAHHLILPKMGGLREFDRVLELARSHSENCTWIFAVDETIWRFFELARGAKPMFDDVIRLEPWSEEGIVRLLERRNEEADIEPQFDHLLVELPEDADEIDVAEAIAVTKGSFFRLLWDYAGGNPGVALHFWRQSLGVDGDGELAVRLFEAPESEQLEGLPDSAVFVLRAIVQLGWAGIEEICHATSLSPAEVQDALRYGWVRGFFDRQDGRYHITWQWFRAITRLLQRRHLIFSQS